MGYHKRATNGRISRAPTVDLTRALREEELAKISVSTVHSQALALVARHASIRG